jgi:uncharacterized integral membrane protein (TIGR00698 family)
MSPEVFASLDSMEGIELYQPRPPRHPARSQVWQRAGLPIAIAVAAASWGLHRFVPLVSPAILAIVLGAAIRNTISLPSEIADDCKGLVKRVIPLMIILTGASVNLTEVAHVGLPSLAVILASITCGCLAAVLAGRVFGTSRNTTILVGCGTAICGTSAIIAAAPVIGAEDDDLLLSVSTINILGLCVMFALPPLGAVLHVTPPAFGIWAGSTVHAVPQAITAGFAYSAQSGTLATLVKLVRVTLLAPFLVVLALVVHRKNRPKLGVAMLPKFVWGFLGLAALNTLQVLPVLSFQLPLASGQWHIPLSSLLTEFGTMLLTLSMAAMGLEVNLRFLFRTGLAAMATGTLASVAQIGLTLALIHWLI